jgi:hypothetical protein
MNRLTTQKARAMNAARKIHAGGRPQGTYSDKPRCKCGAMTLKRARARGHRCFPDVLRED